MNLTDGKLTIEANNSDLAQILRDLAQKSGMTVNGLDQGARVSGVYGPGNPRDVLSALLVGSGYNFIMVGNAADGAPRELLLTLQANYIPASAPDTTATPTANDEEESESLELETNPPIPDVPNSPSSNPPSPDPPSSDPPNPDPPGPEATTPSPVQDFQDDNTRVQQNLQRLQQMQEKQQQKAPQ